MAWELNDRPVGELIAYARGPGSGMLLVVGDGSDPRFRLVLSHRGQAHDLDRGAEVLVLS